MSAPFIFITTHKINPGQLGEFRKLSRQYEEFVHANEPDLLGYYAYLDEVSSEAALVQIHRDAASAEHHMQIAAGKIGQGLAITTTLRAEVYGQPRSIVGHALEVNSAAGAEVSIKPDVLDGFTRSRPHRPA
jgi:quinol monooxygenase YgiN